MAEPVEQQLMDAIRADRDADGPRLVYADWAQEQGDVALAELVRAQVQRASLEPWDEEALTLRIREQHLLQAHGARWDAALPELEGVTWGPRTRGFVAHAVLDDASRLEAHADALRAAVPLEGIEMPWPRFSPTVPAHGLRGIRSLTFDGTPFDPALLAALPSALNEAELRSLRLEDVPLDSDVFRRLVDAPQLADLRTLAVVGHGMGDDVLFDLVDGQGIERLEHLDVSVRGLDELGSQGRDTPQIGSAGAGVLAAWEGAKSLRTLKLSGNEVGDGLGLLLESPHLAGLTRLHLRAIGGDYGEDVPLEPFVGAHEDLSLGVLDLRHNGLTLDSAGALADAFCLSDLQVLMLRSCYEREKGAFRRLAAAPWFDSLRFIDIVGNHSEAWAELLAERSPARLHTLCIGYGRTSRLPQALSTILPSAVGKQLRCLSIGGRVSAEALDVLVGEGDALQQLGWLDFVNPRWQRDFTAEDELRASPLGRRGTLFTVMGPGLDPAAWS